MEPSKYSIVCDFWKFPEEIKNKILIVSIDDFNYDTLSNDALLIILNQHKWNLDIPSELDFVKVSFEYSINIQREFDIHNLHSFPEIIPFRTKNIQYLKKFAEIDAKSYPFESLISIIYQNQKWPFVVKMKNSVIFLYNLDNIIQDLLYERYIKNQRPLVLRFSLLYKFIPKSLLSYLSSFFLRKRLKNNQVLKWPLDLSVDLLYYLFIISLKILIQKPVPYLDFWPNGKKSAIMITHDIDSKAGLINLPKFESYNKHLNIPNTCFCVSNLKLLPILKEIYQSSNLDNYEIAFHGKDHNGQLPFSSKEFIKNEFETFKKEIYTVIPMKGFRSPMLLRSDLLFEGLTPFFDYDSTIPTTDLNIDAISGCCSIFPFYRNQILEIPLTVPMDYVFYNLYKTEQEILTTMNDIIHQIDSLHGLIVLDFHPENHLSGNKRRFRIFQKVIFKIKENFPNSFYETGENLAKWWKARNNCAIITKDSKLVVESNQQDFKIDMFKIKYF